MQSNTARADNNKIKCTVRSKYIDIFLTFLLWPAGSVWTAVLLDCDNLSQKTSTDGQTGSKGREEGNDGE